MTTYLFVAHGTDGDVLPVIRIAGELARRGHPTVLLTHARYSQRVRQAGVRFVAVDTMAADSRSQEDHDVDLNNIGARRDLDRVRQYYQRHGFSAQYRFECRALSRLHQPDHTVLVGLSLSNLSVLTAAEMLGAPAICLAASPYHLIALGNAGAEYAYVFGDDVDAVRGELGLPAVGDWAAWLNSARGPIATWPQWFDAAGAPAPAGTHLVGFVLADEDAGPTPEDDDPGNPHADPGTGNHRDLTGAVLIAGSSGNLTSRAFYQAAATAAVEAGRRAIIVTSRRDLVPDHLPATIGWLPWLPFREVMPAMAAVVHHGGIGIAARALANGTPQFILADGFDRPDNAARLAAAGYADWLPLDIAATAAAGALGQRLSTMADRGRVPLPPGTGPVDSVVVAADAIVQAGQS